MKLLENIPFENYEYGCVYVHSFKGICRGCGCTQNVVNALGVFRGYTQDVALFDLFPFSCVSCKKIIVDHYIIKSLNVTGEFKVKKQ